MNFKTEIENVLGLLKSKGHDRGRIEAKLGYAANSIDQSLARGGTQKLLRVIELYRDYVLLNATDDGTFNSGFQVPGPDASLEQLMLAQRELAHLEQGIRSRIDAILDRGKRNSSGGKPVSPGGTGNLSKADRSGKGGEGS